MKEIILAKCGELVLKGLNRSSFEKTLLKNIRIALKRFGEFNVTVAQSTIYIDKDGGIEDIDEVYDAVKKVFGIAALCRAAADCRARPDSRTIRRSRAHRAQSAPS